MERVFLLLGSNLGDSRQTLSRAVQAIDQSIGNVVAQSPLYQSSAWGLESQPDFLNQAVLINTTLPAASLLDQIKELERQLGRTDTVHWGPRIIDIDILLYGEQIIQTDRLTVPHAQLTARRFALQPLSDLAATMVHPVHRLTIRQLLDVCQDQGVVVRLAE